MSKALVILSELNHRDIDWMVNNGIQEQVTAGNILIHEGQPIDALYIVLEGTLSVSVSTVENCEIGRIGKGEVLGEMSFIDGRLPSATVTAVSDALVLSIPKQQLSQKLEQDMLFALRFYRAVTKFLSSRLRSTVNRFSEPHTEHSSASDAPHSEAVSKFDGILQRLKTQASHHYAAQ